MSELAGEQATLLGTLLSIAKGRLWECYFPDDGPYARHLFPKHMAFIGATNQFNYCNIFGANRSSKSVLLSYIFSRWATGYYPDWWDGRVFERAPTIWVAGQTSELVKLSWQLYLFGADGYSGMVNPDLIEHIDWSKQVPEMINRVTVRHRLGGVGSITFKTYDQGWQRFQSGTVDAVGFDEEMGEPRIYSEACTRVATTNGIVCTAFTALRGITPIVAHLWPEGVGSASTSEELHRYTTFIGWKDIPYSILSADRREQLRKQYLPAELKARTEGIPYIGSGMVYPLAEDQFVVDPFPIPDHWPRAFALDPGFRGKTAGLWAAWDVDSDTLYFYSEHYAGLQEPAVHIDSFRRRPRGTHIPCIIDPAGASVTDGEKVSKVYREGMQAINESWPLHKAEKSITRGIMEVWSRLNGGRLKVFSTLTNWLTEFRQYHRNDEGKIAPTPDHLMDDTRYLCLGTRHFKNVFVKAAPKSHLTGEIYDHW